MHRPLLLVAALICLAPRLDGEAASCSYPDQWSTEGFAFGPVRYFVNTPDCLKSTLFVHYPSKSLQIRNIRTEGEEEIETGLWVFRDGLEGVSVNIPLFGRRHINYTENDKKQGKCDVMTFRTRDNQPMAGAIELHQHLTDLKPRLARDGTIMFYEQNFTSTQPLDTSLKLHNKRIRNRVSGTSNYLYSTFIHRVKIDDKGQCVPLSFLRAVYFGSSCAWHGGKSDPVKLLRAPSWMEYFFAADEKAYQPGKIGKFDRSVPQLSCSNDFASLEEAENKIKEAYDADVCPPSAVLDEYINTCCPMDYHTYTKTESCQIFSKYKLFEPYEQIQSTVCSKKKKFEAGRGKIHYLDNHCFESHPEFKFW